jgi:uncharacterized protein YndB with AHSA1/START domain
MMPANGSKDWIAVPGTPTVVLCRLINASPGRVFEAWTLPENVRRWSAGFQGSSLAVCEIDLRPGGAWRWVQRAADGAEYPFKGVYAEVACPGKLVCTSSFDVEPYARKVSVATLTLTEEAGQTRLAVRTDFPSVGDRDAYLSTGAEPGSKAMLDRLSAYLSQE